MAVETTRQKSLLDFSVNAETLKLIPEYKKRVGFQFEKEVRAELINAGFNKYIVKTNSLNYDHWKSQLQKGADILLKVGNKAFFEVECSNNTKPYKYKKHWFLKDRLSRFSRSNRKNHYLVWLVSNVDKLRNYEDIKFFAKGFNVLLLTISELIQLITTTIANTATTALTLTNTHYIAISKIGNNNTLKSKNNGNLDLNAEIERAKRLGLFDNYGFSS